MEERFMELSCEEFVDRLASEEGVPGGGGAAALVGSLAAALCSMAGALTVGKPRYAAVEPEVTAILEDAEDVRFRLLELVDDDAAGFSPLLEAYALPKDDPRRAAAVESATRGACMAPLAMMGECCRAIVLLEEMTGRCSRLLASDVACGALLASAALQAASVNVFVNTASLPSDETTSSIELACSEMLDEFVPRARALARRLAERSVR